MSSLRPFQENAIQALREPCHLLCISATGSGKSRIYEELARSGQHRVLLITPLIALARQQHRGLVEAGVPAALATGGEFDPPPRGRSGAWIVSPESLRNPKRQALLGKWKPTLLVVDECHCLWEWGDAFRPAFQEIPALIDSHGIDRSLWLTATLPPEARAELRSRLSLVEQGGFSLPSSLELEVRRVPWVTRSEALLRALHELPGPGIIFVGRRESTLRVQRLVEASRKSSVIYHAGLSSEERQAVEAQISARLPDVVIATSAFGMGMNHAHLRWVILWQSPPTLLALAQAIGRAGRGGVFSRSRARIFWDEEDFHLLEWTLQGSERRQRELLSVSRFFRAEGCRVRELSRYFEPESEFSRCGECDYCKVFQNNDGAVV